MSYAPAGRYRKRRELRHEPEKKARKLESRMREKEREKIEEGWEPDEECQASMTADAKNAFQLLSAGRRHILRERERERERECAIKNVASGTRKEGVCLWDIGSRTRERLLEQIFQVRESPRRNEFVTLSYLFCSGKMTAALMIIVLSVFAFYNNGILVRQRSISYLVATYSHVAWNIVE